MRKILFLACVLGLVGCGPSIDKDKMKPADDGAPNNGTPNNTTLNNGTPNNGTPNNGTPNNGTPNNGTPNNGTPNNTTPNNTTPNNATPNNASPNNNNGSSCLTVSSEDELNFGPSSIGNTRAKSLVLSNCSRTENLVVSGIEICDFVDGGTTCQGGGVFGLDDLPAGLPNLVLQPDETVSFVATFTPSDLSTSSGELTILSNDPAKSELVIDVVGRGVDSVCPEANATVRTTDMTTGWTTDLTTIPLKTVEFSAADSYDPDGAIERYEWTIVQKPTNSTTRFTPTSDVMKPTLFLDLAGVYVIELDVFDDDGLGSCAGQNTVTIHATPDEDIHVQLVWDTPSDSDQTDGTGTDLDLHFLHPNGMWNEVPWDIFWNNPDADWGPPGLNGDPSLDIDDVDGAGPENVNLDGPVQGINYSVGVYYYADNGFGPSYATVRIFINGVQQFEQRNKLMEKQQTFWKTAVISWPSASVSSVDQIVDGFPN